MAGKFNFAEARKKAIRIADQELEQGLEQMAEQGGGVAVPQQQTEQAPAEQKPAEPTKGVQTYIPMSQYRRLNDIKLTRRENIADLAAQAINLWLDVQDGKLVVTKPE
jgi:hypothetical protein